MDLHAFWNTLDMDLHAFCNIQDIDLHAFWNIQEDSKLWNILEHSETSLSILKHSANILNAVV